jgi:hypothetical protein
LRREVTALFFSNRFNNGVDALQNPHASFIACQPSGAVFIVRPIVPSPVIDCFSQAEQMACDLGTNSRLSSQTRNGYNRRGNTSNSLAQRCIARRICEEQAIFRVDMYGKVWMRLCELVYQLHLIRAVYRVPQCPTALFCVFNVRCGWGSRGFCGESAAHIFWEACSKATQAIDGPWNLKKMSVLPAMASSTGNNSTDPIEANAFESYFPHEFGIPHCCINAAAIRACRLMKQRQGFWRVHCHCCGSLLIISSWPCSPWIRQTAIASHAGCSTLCDCACLPIFS